MGSSIIMDIYQTTNIEEKKVYYFVPDVETQTAGEAIGIPNSIWIVGDLTAANQQLVINQNDFLNDPTTAVHFSCLKCIGQDSEGHNIWESCDLTTEQPNDNVLYELFCDVIPGFQSAIGLDQANSVFANEQQALLVWIGLNEVITLHALPPKPKP